MAGTPTLTRIEYFTQAAYFAFQIIQVFLVTTLTSAVSASLTQILEKPLSATTLLSQNLPKSSNFYISYILVQCVGVGATALLQPFALWKFGVIHPLTKDSRKTYERYHRLQRIHWGSKFPVYANLGVISRSQSLSLIASAHNPFPALSYALIAPLIIAFSLVGTAFIYVIYRYNILYVYDSEIDTRGLVYPRALSHLLTGLYFAEGCMIGLFALKYAAGPIALMIILLAFTILVHMTLLDAIGPLLHNLPRSLYRDVQAGDADELNQPTDEPELDPDNPEPVAVHNISDTNNGQHDSSDEEDPDTIQMDQGTHRSPEGLPSALKVLAKGAQSFTLSRLKKELGITSIPSKYLSPFTEALAWLNPRPLQPATASPRHGSGRKSGPDFIQKFLHPQIYASFDYFRDEVLDQDLLRQQAQAEAEHPYPPGVDEKFIYFPPAMYAKPPTLIIPRDPAGVSEQERRHCEKVGLVISEDGAWLDVDDESREVRTEDHQVEETITKQDTEAAGKSGGACATVLGEKSDEAAPVMIKNRRGIKGMVTSWAPLGGGRRRKGRPMRVKVDLDSTCYLGLEHELRRC